MIESTAGLLFAGVAYGTIAFGLGVYAATTAQRDDSEGDE